MNKTKTFKIPITDKQREEFEKIFMNGLTATYDSFKLPKDVAELKGKFRLSSEIHKRK